MNVSSRKYLSLIYVYWYGLTQFCRTSNDYLETQVHIHKDQSDVQK